MNVLIVQKLKRAIRAAQIWVERNSDTDKVYQQTMIIMNAICSSFNGFGK